MEYEILIWDAVLATNGINKWPVIYMKGDKKFNKYIRNNYIVNIQIQNTNTIYDDKNIDGLIDKHEGDIYSITLKSLWYGYPDSDSLGTVTFL